ncbi:MAG: transglutaminase-like domain-containing protein [Zavarzinella sp.]
MLNQFISTRMIKSTIVCSIFLNMVLTAHAQTLSKAIQLNPATTFEVTMTTKLVVPAGKQVSNLRVYHALPTVRPWQNRALKHGASSKYLLEPKSGKQQIHAATNSVYVLWQTPGTLKAGENLEFTTTMTIPSPKRSLNLLATPNNWKELLRTQADKTAVIDVKVKDKLHPDVVQIAKKLQANNSPAQTVTLLCDWIKTNLRYDASVRFNFDDIDSIMQNRCGHCGHQSSVLQQMTASLGIPYRTVWGLNLYAPDGVTSQLQKVRADYTNIHTWAEVYLPRIGWVEVDPGLGNACFEIPATLIQNNRWFQNYSVWFSENGIDKAHEWIPVSGGFRSDYQLEHIISYKQR